MRYLQMTYTIVISLFITTDIIHTQVPTTEIEGRLVVFLPNDKTAIHIGQDAGINQDLNLNFSTGNTFVGNKSGTSNTDGSLNSFFGGLSGNENISGDRNSFYGYASGIGLISGNQNCFFGGSSGASIKMGSFNSFYGTFAGRQIKKGDYNICLGYQSGPTSPDTIANYRLFIDVESGLDPLIYGEFDNDYLKINGTGDYADILRVGTDVATPSYPGTGEGLELVYDASRKLGLIQSYDRDNTSWGNLYLGEGSVGIGTTSPDRNLHVNGIQKISDDNNWQLEIDNFGSEGSTWRIGSSNVNWNAGGGKFLVGNDTNSENAHLVILDDGKIGIGTTNPTSTLDVDGDIRLRNINSQNSQISPLYRNAQGEIVLSSSDLRLKENLVPFGASLAKVVNMNAYYYNYIDDTTNSVESGLIAQELEEIAPELVFENNGYKGILYEKLTPYLIEAIKEQQAIIDKQQQQIEDILELLYSSNDSK